MPLIHTHSVRVYYEDTDFSGVVYHGSYVRFLERGRSEFLRVMGLHHRALFEGGRSAAPLGFVVRALHLEFLSPARMDDLVVVETQVSEIRGASARMAQRILRDGDVLVTGDVRFAVVAGGRAIRFPVQVREALAKAAEGEADSTIS